MKIKKVFVTLFTIFGLMFGLMCSSKPQTEIKLSQNVQKMIKYAKKSETHKAINLFKSFDNNEAEQFVKYLENNPGELPPIYFILISDKVYGTDKDKAVFFYNFGKIRASEDVSMCKDTSARQQLGLYGMMAPKTITYMQSKATDEDYLNNLFYKVIDWDNKYTNRVSPIWACYHGVSSFYQEPELLPDEEFPKIQEKTHNSLKNMAEIIKKQQEQINNNSGR